jgi:hypothetical protein
VSDPLLLDIENNQSDRAAAYMLAGLLQGRGEEERAKAITQRLREITQAEEDGVRAPSRDEWDVNRVGMRWTISSLCSIKSMEMATQIPALFGEVMQAHPELMFVTDTGSSVFVVSGEYLSPETKTIDEVMAEREAIMNP